MVPTEALYLYVPIALSLICWIEFLVFRRRAGGESPLILPTQPRKTSLVDRIIGDYWTPPVPWPTAQVFLVLFSVIFLIELLVRELLPIAPDEEKIRILERFLISSIMQGVTIILVLRSIRGTRWEDLGLGLGGTWHLIENRTSDLNPREGATKDSDNLEREELQQGSTFVRLAMIPLTAVIGWLLVYAPTFPMILLFQKLLEEDPHEFTTLLTENPSSETFFIVGFAATLAAPLIEELIFRVLLQSIVRRKYNSVIAVCVSSLVFVFVHHYSTWIPLLPLALTLGWIYERTRSYPTVFLIHALFNAYTVGGLLISPARP